MISGWEWVVLLPHQQEDYRSNVLQKDPTTSSLVPHPPSFEWRGERSPSLEIRFFLPEKRVGVTSRQTNVFQPSPSRCLS